MNATDFIQFLGHSSIHPAFDQFLSKSGIIWRPSLKKNLDTLYFIKGCGISISFTSSAESEGVKIKSDGNFIFENLTITIMEENKKNGKYSGPLPKGILQSDSKDQIEAKLGDPVRRNESSNNYYLDGLVWIVAFKEDKLRFLSLRMPTNIWRENGICP